MFRCGARREAVLCVAGLRALEHGARERGIVAPPARTAAAAPPPPPTTSSDDATAAAIHMRNEQWRVRWAGEAGPEADRDTWEAWPWGVLDTEEMRASARAL